MAPEQAARYQMVILFCIAGTACASLVAACQLAVCAALDGQTHRVRREVRPHAPLCVFGDADVTTSSEAY